jgi:hypothetical protein
MFQGRGAVFHTMGAWVHARMLDILTPCPLGFEYWADPNNFITWQIDGSPTYRLGASAVGPVTLVRTEPGSANDLYLIEEPMSVALNLGITSNRQTRPNNDDLSG